MRTCELAAAIFEVISSSMITQSQEARPRIDVMVYVKNSKVVPHRTSREARATASWMYARIGVHLAWQDDEPRTPDTFTSPMIIEVQFNVGTPRKVHPGALAYASPIAKRGSVIVLWDRIREESGLRELEGAILAHVLAHEIGHVLQGSARHSDIGVMKAQWDEQDFEAMERTPLRFTSTDLDLIKQGLNRRMTRATYQAAGPS
jgi:Zn-dependent protease with chaperone function